MLILSRPNVISNHSFSLGANTLVRHGIWWFDSIAIGYPSNANYVIYNTATGAQRILPLPTSATQLTAVSISRNGRYVALAGRDTSPVLVVYDLQGETQVVTKLKSTEVTAAELTCLCFSDNCHLVAAVTSGPDHSLLAINWQASRVVASLPSIAGASVHVTHISFAPGSDSNVLIIGSRLLAAYSLSEQQIFRTIPVSFHQGSANFTCAAWLDSQRVVLGADNGTIYSMTNYDVKQTFTVDEGASAIVDLAPINEASFLAVTVSSQFLHYEVPPREMNSLEEFVLVNQKQIPIPALDEQQEALRQVRKTVVEPVAVDVTGDLVTVITAVGSVISFSLSGKVMAPRGAALRGFAGPVQPGERVTPASLTTAISQAIESGATATLRDTLHQDDEGQASSVFIVPPAHGGAVTSLGFAVTRPLLMSASTQDRSIYITNYTTTATEVAVSFADEVLCAAIHPSGLFVAAGFPDRLRLFYIGQGKLALAHEFPLKQARAVSFSSGGHLIAAAVGSTAFIYTTYTQQLVAELHSHGRVTSLSFGVNDQTLALSAIDGSAVLWALNLGDDVSRVCEISDKTTSFTSVEANSQRQLVVCAADFTLRESVIPGSPHEIIPSVVRLVRRIPQVVTLVGTGATKGAQLSGSWALVGMNTGTVAQFVLPLTTMDENSMSGSRAPECEIPVCQGQVTAIAASHDGGIVAVGGQFGQVSIFVYSGISRPTQIVPLAPYGSVVAQYLEPTPIKSALFPPISLLQQPQDISRFVLVDRDDIAELEAQNSQLRHVAIETAEQSVYQSRLSRSQAANEVASLRELMAQAAADNQAQLDALQEQLVQERERSQAELNEAHAERQREYVAIMERNERGLSEAVAENSRLRDDMERLRQNNNAQLERISADRAQDMAMAAAREQERVEEIGAALETAIQAKADSEQQYQERLRQTEEDASAELALLRHQLEQELADERQRGIRANRQASMANHRCDELQKFIDQQKSEVAMTQLTIQGLNQQIQDLLKQVAQLTADLEDREATVVDKEAQLNELRAKNQELEKLRFVLCFKIREVKRQVEPREAELAALKTDLGAKENELLEFAALRVKLELKNSQLQQRLDAMTRSNSELRDQVQFLGTYRQRVEGDITRASQLTSSPPELREAVVQMFHNYCSERPKLNAADESALAAQQQVIDEVTRQREHLQRAAEAAQRRNEQERKLHNVDLRRAVEQNVELVHEVNRLRRELQERDNDGGSRDDSAALMRAHAENADLRRRLAELQQQIAEANTETESVASMSRARPKSGIELPLIRG